MVVNTAVRYLNSPLKNKSDERIQMLGNLKNPPEPFVDVIQTHFRLKSKAIIDQLDKWLKLDDGHTTNGANNGGTATGIGSSGAAFQRDVSELKTLLRSMSA